MPYLSAYAVHHYEEALYQCTFTFYLYTGYVLSSVVITVIEGVWIGHGTKQNVVGIGGAEN